MIRSCTAKLPRIYKYSAWVTHCDLWYLPSTKMRDRKLSPAFVLGVNPHPPSEDFSISLISTAAVTWFPPLLWSDEKMSQEWQHDTEPFTKYTRLYFAVPNRTHPATLKQRIVLLLANMTLPTLKFLQYFKIIKPPRVMLKYKLVVETQILNAHSSTLKMGAKMYIS